MLLLQVAGVLGLLVQGIVCPLWLWNGRTRDHGLMVPPLKVPEVLATDPIEWGTYDQQLDHFDDSERRTWKQRYLVNPLFAQPGGPGFLQFGGEGPVSEGFLQTANATKDYLMDWMKNAQIYNATAFILEHRYFGESIPIEGADRDARKMRYLTSRQALADAAEFIGWATNKYSVSKWVVFGGSYSGSLAAWMREQYPDVVVGAVSSSGPLQGIVQYSDHGYNSIVGSGHTGYGAARDRIHCEPLYVVCFSDYYKIAGDDLQKFNPRCFSETERAFAELETLVAGDQATRDALGHQLNLCHAFDPTDVADLSAIFDALSGPFMTTAQYGGDNRPPYDTTSVPNLCAVMLNDVEHPNRIDRLLAVGRFVTRQNNTQGGNWDCIDNSYGEQIRSLGEMNSMRGWTWMTCNEFGWFQTTDDPTQPFGRYSPLNLRQQMCVDVFGTALDGIPGAVEATNKLYGGQRNYTGTNVALINGSQDPWYVVGAWNKEWQREGQHIYFLEGQAHCSDMYPVRNNDTQLIGEARQEITRLIGEWLA